MRHTLNDLFKSKAKVIYLNNFYKANLKWTLNTIDNDTQYQVSIHKDGQIYPRMPVILKSNGLPWNIGNSYLIGLLSQPSLSNLRSLSSRAIFLKFYLQYLEDSNQNFLDLPKTYSKRAPQKFKIFMVDVLNKYNFSATYINNILSTVAHFYREIIHQSLLPLNSFENDPFTEVNKRIMTENSVGLSRFIEVTTSDLKVKSSRSPYPQLGKIRDGGSLRPLTLREQEIIFQAFRNNLASIELELMIRIAIITGARQQTICTLSIACIEEANEILENDPSLNSVVINAGQRFRADSKSSRHNRLHFNRKLINDLINYIYSERAEYRRNHINSFYGHTSENYVFLTRVGNPYLSAQREIAARQTPKPEWNESAPSMNIKSGQSLRNELDRFVKRVQACESGFCKFSFHDLRATSGMNLVRSMREKNYPDSKVFDYVRQHLNHKNIKTTEVYLSFDAEIEEFNEIQEGFGEIFNRIVEY